MQLIIDFFRTSVVDISGNSINGVMLRRMISERYLIDVNLIYLRLDGRSIADYDEIGENSSGYIRASIKQSLVGGKGGFGAMLRSLAKQSGKKKTTDFGACRDLNGRRLRHVNDEKILQKWREAKDRDEEFDVEQMTASGIDLWFLDTPTWTDGVRNKVKFRKSYMKPRRKTQLCLDWLRARENGPPPKGSPMDWGCPRGPRCEFAHGEEELRGDSLLKIQNQRKNRLEAEDTEKKTAYLSVVYENEKKGDDAMLDSVLVGLRKQKQRVPKRISVEPTKQNEEKGNGDGRECATDVRSVVTGQPTSLDEIVSSGEPAALHQTAEIHPAKSAVFPINTKAALNAGTEVAEESLSVEPIDISPYVTILSGNVTVSAAGVVEGIHGFGTFVFAGRGSAEALGGMCLCREGDYCYEVKLLTDGLLQVGGCRGAALPLRYRWRSAGLALLHPSTVLIYLVP